MSGDAVMSKKDYLKKYLSGGDKKKKKKKVSQNPNIISTIVDDDDDDDDVDLKHMKPINDQQFDLYELAEDAPQIAGIVDERPEEVRLKDSYKWKIVGDESGESEVKITRRENESDRSPPRRKDHSKDRKSDSSPPRKREKKEDSDASPPRSKQKHDKTKKRSHSDASPNRSKTKYDSDASPPRSKKRSHNQNSSLKEKTKYDSDASPPRARKSKNSEPTKHKIKVESPSPPRRSHKHNSPDHSKKRDSRGNDSDNSPPRRHGHHDSRNYPRSTNDRRYNSVKVKEELVSDDSVSEVRHNGSSRHHDRSRRNDHGSSKRAERTLDGKKAGLQNADDLKRETSDFRKRQNEAFAKMSDDVSGRNATAVVRDRRTGRRRDLVEENRKRREEDEKRAERDAKYAVWGKGVKQIEDRQDKLEQEKYEMSKPLARYADDKDLDIMLKKQDREGDPMLEYIQKKRDDEEVERGGGPKKPVYKGSYAPNRYSIRPGYRWDGVDRSNGYEKKWFDEQNAKKAREEEAFKWSTADM